MFPRLLGFILLTTLASCASLNDRDIASNMPHKNERLRNLER
jgi:hypothetical protein